MVGRDVRHLNLRGSLPLHGDAASIGADVEAEACPPSSHGGQVDAQVEQVPDPGTPEVVGGRDPGLEPRSRQIRQASAGLRRAS